MSKVLRPKNIVLVLAVVALLSSVAGSTQSSEGYAHTACETLEKTQNDSGDVMYNVSGEVKLNGTTVDTVNCSNFEAYTFPEQSGHGDTSPGFSLLYYLIGVLAPLAVVVSTAGGLWKADYFERQEIAKIFGTSIALVGLTIFGIVFLAANFSSDLVLVPVIFLMFGGPFLPSLVTYYRQKRRGIESRKIGALTAFIFTSMIYWCVIIYWLIRAPVVA